MESLPPGDFSTYVDAGGLPVAESTPDASTVTSRVFDALGNLTAESYTGSGVAAVNKAYTRDAAGRLTAAGPLTFAYNDRDQLIASGGNSNTATFTYDLR